MNEIKIHMGQRQTAYTSTFPARRYWFRHDNVSLDGVMLSGHIQTRCRFGRIDVMTSFKDSCVQGRQVEWLVRMNGVPQITEVKIIKGEN